MHKLFKNKKGIEEEMWTVIKFILGALVFVCAIAILWYVFTGESILDSVTKQYTQSQLIDNIYMTVEYVKVDENLMGLGISCDKKADYYSCKPKGNLYMSVKITNTGSKAIAVYAKPRIGIKCDDSGKCANEFYKEGLKRCILAPGVSTECSVDEGIVFDEANAEYRIYPGAAIKAQDYYELTGQIATQDMYAYNGKSWLVVKTDRP